MIDLVLYGIYMAMLVVALYGYLTELENVIGLMVLLTLSLVIIGCIGILNSNL
jgi:hypothetical protein